MASDVRVPDPHSPSISLPHRKARWIIGILTGGVVATITATLMARKLMWRADPTLKAAAAGRA